MPYDQYSGYSSYSYNNQLVNVIGKAALDVAYEFCKILVYYNIHVIN